MKNSQKLGTWLDFGCHFLLPFGGKKKTEIICRFFRFFLRPNSVGLRFWLSKCGFHLLDVLLVCSDPKNCFFHSHFSFIPINFRFLWPRGYFWTRCVLSHGRPFSLITNLLRYIIMTLRRWEILYKFRDPDLYLLVYFVYVFDFLNQDPSNTFLDKELEQAFDLRTHVVG